MTTIQLKSDTYGVKTFLDGSKLFVKLVKFNSKGITIASAQKWLKSQLVNDNNKYEFKIACLYQDSWRSNKGGFHADVSKVKVLDPSVEYNTDFAVTPRVFQMAIYVRRNLSEPQGGSGPSNACLFACLSQAMPTQARFKYDNQLKRHLGLTPSDKVPVSKLGAVEDALKCNIHVVGDVDRQSAGAYAKSVTLQLVDGHYTLAAHNSKQLLAKVSHKPKAVLTYWVDPSTNHITTFDGAQYATQLYDDAFKTRVFNSFRKIKSGDEYFLEVKHTGNKRDLHAKWFAHTAVARRLMEESEAKINLVHNPNTTSEALRVFYNCSRCIEPEELGPIESLWIQKAFKGGLRFSKPGTYSDFACYDVNKQYSSILSSAHFRVPIKQGQFATLEELPLCFNYGIYRCTVHAQASALFSPNVKGYYTHLDLKRARELGYTIELTQDGAPNALLYKGNATVAGSVMFKPFFDYLYGVYGRCASPDNARVVKLIMNSLWGALCSKNTKTRLSTMKKASARGNIVGIVPAGHDLLITYENLTKPYKFDYARLGPFLTAKARFDLSHLMEPYVDAVAYCHTDGFVVVGPHTPPPLGANMGQLKQEDKGDTVTVTHVCTYSTAS